MVKSKQSADSSDDDYDSWTVLELRDTLKQNGLSTEGNKKELIARLKAAPVREYGSYSVVELKEMLRENKLSTKGNKKDLIKRLENYDENGTDSEKSAESEEEPESEEEKKTTSKKKKKNSVTGTKRRSTSRSKERKKSPARKKAKSGLKFEEENIYCDDKIPSFEGEFDDSDDYPKSIVCLADNGRSKCKSCRTNIRKDSVKVGTQHKIKETDEIETRWYHVRCLQVPKKILKPTDITNYSSCETELQELIAEQFKKTKIAPIAASPKKTAAKTKSSETAARKKEYRDACLSLGDLTVADLKAILRKNNQRVSGPKAELQLAVGEGMLHGAIPKCTKCGGGYLHFNKSFDQLSCVGYRDDDDFIHCDFKADPKTIKREPWIKKAEEDE